MSLTKQALYIDAPTLISTGTAASISFGSKQQLDVSPQMLLAIKGDPGPQGPKALPILLIDPARPVAFAARETAIYRMDYTNGLPTFAKHTTSNLEADWSNRETLNYD
jgi:hypothetical protein